MAGKILLHGVGGNTCGNAPAVDTAHTVADDAPGGAACQLLRTVVVLIFLRQLPMSVIAAIFIQVGSFRCS